MWDLKLNIIYFMFDLNNFFYDQIIFFFNIFDPFFLNGLTLFNWKFYYKFVQNVTFFFALKFLLMISFLILIRCGTPRYRYDYLTKLGWLKFIGFIVLIFFFLLLLLFIY